MATFDLRFPPQVRDSLHRLADQLDPESTHAIADRAEIPADADEDFAALWHDAVSERVVADASALRDLLADPAFGEAPVSLSDDEAMGALRGFTVIRFALRTGLLGAIPDAALETGTVDRRTLKVATRHVYACYCALGEIQSALCESLGE